MGIKYHYAVVELSSRKWGVMETYTSKLEGTGTHWKLISQHKSWEDANQFCSDLVVKNEEERSDTV